jgi:hypothetical protein
VQTPTPSRLVREARSRLPATAGGWVRLATGALSVVVVVGMVVFVLAPVLAHAHGYGRDGWDAAESQRYLVSRSLRLFHEVPWWDPYTCGGHPAWGAFEGDTAVVTPALPAYLLLSLPVAMRVEVVLSALWCAAGAWALASRFTKSWPARAFLVALFAVDGRFALQLAAGNTAHLAYAWMPWALFLFDQAAGTAPRASRDRTRSAVLAGACVAMMVYAGGVDALPQTAVLLAAYALILALATRRIAPLGMLAATAAAGFGLSAPKLLPALAVLRRFPPSGDAGGSLDPTQLTQLLTNREQGFAIGHAGIPDGAWHDVGMYVGWPALILLGAGVLASRGTRARPLAALGGVCLVLGLGAFSTRAPWVLFHELPIADREHVAARWLYPAILLFACVAVASFERVASHAERWRPRLEVVALLGVAWIAWDVGTVARYPLMNHLAEAGPTNPEVTPAFRTVERAPHELEYQGGDPGPTTLSTMRANLGSLECDTFDGLSSRGGRAPSGSDDGVRPFRHGARDAGDSAYRGEVFLDAGGGGATVAGWSPDGLDVAVQAAQPGALVVVNQNYDPGWSVDGAPALDHTGLVAARVSSSAQTLRFRYRPVGLVPGLVVFVLTVGAWAFIERERGRRRRRSGPAAPT